MKHQKSMYENQNPLWLDWFLGCWFKSQMSQIFTLFLKTSAGKAWIQKWLPSKFSSTFLNQISHSMSIKVCAETLHSVRSPQIPLEPQIQVVGPKHWAQFEWKQYIHLMHTSLPLYSLVLLWVHQLWSQFLWEPCLNWWFIQDQSTWIHETFSCRKIFCLWHHHFQLLKEYQNTFTS